eukprot:CAMPEP_0197613194 /NCGR_PEP_ID=MMETSP1326-20131121/58733_1 /TAXON_ID=1155430 /ORGANISM="Genus nov. species nov., Strain RCC2288" /LENGTH=353 /DNA_ID=CAMNT_0043182039 /DNA_START=50 /DNA_END=1111 /DNA_ORIENTATION=+
MTFGWKFASEECGDDASRQMMETFLGAGHTEVDTAFAYSGGETEKIMGRVFAQHPSLLTTMSIATKANPWPKGNMTSSSGRGGLSPTQLRAQLEASCASLAPGTVDLLYLHAPDGDTPIEDTLTELAKLHAEGKFKRLGLSNFAAWEVVYIHRRCAELGMVLPTVYQGMYNCVTRACEPELVPALRKLNMAFLVYNPLAGGLLTGKHHGTGAAGAPEGSGDGDGDGSTSSSRGRFVGNAMYQDRFWKPEYFAAVDAIRAACDEAAPGPDGARLTVAAAALRWLYSHSELDGAKGDGVILGASSVGQLQLNLGAAAAAARGEPLPQEVVAAMDAAWEVCKPAAPPYSRGHSKIV